MKLRESTLWPGNTPPAPAFCGESERAKIIAAHGLDSLADDPELTAITRFAAQLCDVPVSLVTLVESERQRFLGSTGVEVDGTPRSTSFCAYAMMGSGLLIVPDATRDPRFAEFELVTGDFGLRFYAGAPLISAEGAPIGALCVIHTVARPGGLTEFQQQGLAVLAQAAKRRIQGRRETRENEAELARRASEFRTLGDWLPDIIWSADGKGRFDYFNGRWQAITGGKPPIEADDWRPFIHDEDHEQTFGNWTNSLARGEAYENEYRLRQSDGGWRWTLSRALPVKDESGAVVRWYGTLTDIDERRRQADTNDTLAHELAHRIKNVFALISGLVSVRTRGREELREFGEDLVGTISALGKAQDFIRPTGGASELRGLVRAVLEPFTGEDGRLTVQGETAPVGARAATPLALVLHELATNSVKYGALSTDSGAIDIALREEHGDGVVLEWTERGGPEPVEPDPGQRTRGFGTRLIDMSVTSQLDGTIARDWRKGGLAVTIGLPRDTLAS
ncbi:PAS domain-containing protein [Pelagerythrobacter sp.]|uniref:PAS domain-containing protein n=1 Tax=Pelagerythrobacter sp. TaxID=2800702 RepID=UPI0035AE4CE3